MDDLLVRYLHFIGIMLLCSALVVQNMLLARDVSTSIFKKLVAMDALYGLSAIVIFVAGCLLWLTVGKPKSFYSTNMLFQIKLIIFVSMAILSVVPTAFFLRRRALVKTEQVESLAIPHYILVIKRLELVLVLTLPLLAVLMARGVGL
ncbi:DUF2214 family protein [Marinomonas agarivorans]|nr:DUF2214 family protein [Marinomonas agarivorans]